MNKSPVQELPEPTYAILPKIKLSEDKKKKSLYTTKRKKYINQWYHSKFLSNYFDAGSTS